MSEMFDSRIINGQGKTVTTILTEGGYHYPVVHEPYSHRVKDGLERSRRALSRVYRGDRPMHKTTLTLAKPPWYPDYTSTHKQYFSGSKTLDPPCRPTRCPSIHTSKIVFGTDKEPGRFLSDHKATYTQQNNLLPGPPILESIRNKLNQVEGAEAKDTIQPDKEPQSYWSQYNRTHNFQGLLRRSGVAREFPVRQIYDVITEEEKGHAWKPNNARVSGNRIQYHYRKQFDLEPLLF